MHMQLSQSCQNGDWLCSEAVAKGRDALTQTQEKKQHLYILRCRDSTAAVHKQGVLMHVIQT